MGLSDHSRRVKRDLASTALGEEKADLAVKNSTLINVYSGELLEGSDVAVKHGRIALVGDSEHTVGAGTRVIDAEGKYLAPGFLDGHVHIDDSMGTVSEFARVVLPRGTTGVFMDPHEIANVLGLWGVRLMIEESRRVPLRVYICIPSCVPATSSEFETAGGSIGVDEVKEALTWDETVALGEMMNYNGLVLGDEVPHAMIEETLKAGKVVEGHAPGLKPKKLNAYIAAGVTSCHESTEKSEVLEKLRLGMYPMIREGFASIKNLSELIRIVTEEDIDTKRISLVTDDRHPEDLVNDGHMDHVVRRAIEEGVDPIEAIQMATVNTATHFNVDGLVGGIAPGRHADMVLLEDLSSIGVSEVIAEGKVVARDREPIREFGSFQYPEGAKETVRIPRKLTPGDFEIRASSERGIAEARVIGVDENLPVTKNLTEKLPVEEGLVQTSIERDVAKIAVVERHGREGNIGLGFVKGFGFVKGATGSTIAHDSHNLLLVGVKEEDMATAANRLAEVGGGIITVDGGEVLGSVELPIAGLMSDRPLEKTQEKMEKLSETWKELGCKMESPFPTIILLSLPVLPELRITDRGLIDTEAFRKVDLLKE